jgi:hypothetical protein
MVKCWQQPPPPTHHLQPVTCHVRMAPALALALASSPPHALVHTAAPTPFVPRPVKLSASGQKHALFPQTLPTTKGASAHKKA